MKGVFSNGVKCAHCFEQLIDDGDAGELYVLFFEKNDKRRLKCPKCKEITEVFFTSKPWVEVRYSKLENVK